MELIVDCNDMAVGLAMLNAEKYVNAKESLSKKVEEAAEMAKNKAAKNAEEANKQNEVIPGFQAEIQKHAIDGIISSPDDQMWQYIHYLFKKKVVNLSKTNKVELKIILSPLLEHHNELMQTTTDLVADVSTGDAETPSADSVEEV